MNKSILYLLLIVSVGANIYLATKSCKDKSKTTQTEEPYRNDNDKRYSILLKKEHRDFVMGEMRTFIESMQLIQEGILEGNPELLFEAGQQSGTHAKPPQELRDALPKEFLQMGMATHKLFDAIADSARINFHPELAGRQMNMLFNKCIACHSTYRFEVQ